MNHFSFDAPDNDMYRLWRAVFALVHADGDFSQEERDYIDKIILIFSFTTKQKRIIKSDLKKKKDVVMLFDEIESIEHRRQFFVIARTIVWCDGFLHALELAALNKIISNLGDNAEMFKSEVRWLQRKPQMDAGYTKNVPEGGMMDIVIAQMAAFYKEKII